MFVGKAVQPASKSDAGREEATTPLQDAAHRHSGRVPRSRQQPPEAKTRRARCYQRENRSFARRIRSPRDSPLSLTRKSGQSPIRSISAVGHFSRIAQHVAILHRRRIARQGPGGRGRRLSGRRARAARRRSTTNCAAGRGDTAAVAASRSNRIASRSSAGSGAARRSAAPSPCWSPTRTHDRALDELACPRPGHGDLSGAIKHLGSIRGVLERASARETAARVAAGALAKQLLAPLGIDVLGYVAAIGPIAVPPRPTRHQPSSSSDCSAIEANSIPSTPTGRRHSSGWSNDAKSRATRWAD